MMRKNLRLGCVVLASTLFACASHADSPDHIDAVEVSNISIPMAQAISYVYRDYSKMVSDASCIEISYRETVSGLQILAYSNVERESVADGQIQVTAGDEGICGPYMRYEFTVGGEFIESVGLR